MVNIKLVGIDKNYGDVQVIKDLNLEIKDRELMVLVGPSGCGKSTALRMIAGLEEITAGELFIADRLVNDVHPKDRDVAMVFQSYALYPHMTVRENIGFGLKIRKLPKEEIIKKVNDIAVALELTEYLDRKPKALSGGQRQRVALGRAIVREPSVFLFDEPLSNLDAELRVQMRSEISQLQKRLGITSVYVTHDQVEAMTMGNRICVMKKGDVMQVGTPLELYDTPQNTFVAHFIGTPPMNLFTAKMNDKGNSVHYQDTDIPLSENWLPLLAAYKGKDVVVGIRPTDVGDEDLEAGHSVALKGRVKLVEPLGHEVIVHFEIGKDVLVAKFGPHHIPELGSEASFNLNCEKIHLFDKQTEKRIS